MNNTTSKITAEAYKKAYERQAIGNRAVAAAQARNRAMGVPNHYSINGTIIAQMPDGSIIVTG